MTSTEFEQYWNKNNQTIVSRKTGTNKIENLRYETTIQLRNVTPDPENKSEEMTTPGQNITLNKTHNWDLTN